MRSYAVFTFLSALLLFMVQPLMARAVLPWFGGAPAVWTLCLAFFQTTLFLGYAYAHLLVRFATGRTQLVIHTLAIGAALLSLPVLPVANPAWEGDLIAGVNITPLAHRFRARATGLQSGTELD